MMDWDMAAAKEKLSTFLGHRDPLCGCCGASLLERSGADLSSGCFFFHQNAIDLGY